MLEEKTAAALQTAKEDRAERVHDPFIWRFIKDKKDREEHASQPFIAFWKTYVAAVRRQQIRLPSVVLGPLVELGKSFPITLSMGN